MAKRRSSLYEVRRVQSIHGGRVHTVPQIVAVTCKRLVARERRQDGAVAPSRLFPCVRRIYPGGRADRILAYMGNGVSLDSAIRATGRRRGR